MSTNNVSQDRTIPYWDEIKKLSIEDKYSLIAKIESSLGDVDMSESTNLIHGIIMELDFRKFRSYRQINMKQKLFKNLVVSQTTLIFATN